MILLGRRSKVGLLDSSYLFVMAATWFIFVCRAQNTSSMTPIGAPQADYSKNPQIRGIGFFNVLFSRRIKIHLSDQFPEASHLLFNCFPGSLGISTLYTLVQNIRTRGNRRSSH